MDKSPEQNSAAAHLYPPIEPFERRMLDVDDGHHVYVEQCGRPDGLPVVVLHGGPGGGASPMMRRFFDPDVYRVVLFDQRGCGRSRPHASIEANTTAHLLADIEAIREVLGIQRWVLFGGSWGATLALAYAQAHPERAAYLVLRGVFLGTQAELRWFYGGGAGRFFPELWARFVDPIPESERHDLIAAYRTRLFCGVYAQETRFARLWAEWENALATVDARAGFETPADYARAFSRLENHYFSSGCFLGHDGALLAGMSRMAGVSGTIVQGRLDMICPPVTAWELHRNWPGSELRMVPLAGHALSEPGIAAELVRVTDQLRTTLT
ncbi:MAG: prolyl aminopeptidase [Pararhodobacter sp.]